MATLVLGAAGAALGGSIGGSILGVSAATIGGFVGSAIGGVVDNLIVAALTPGQNQRVEGARLDTLRLTSSVEGLVVPRVYGRMRLGGNIIWATDFREEIVTTTERVGGGGKAGGGGGARQTVTTTTYFYFASFAVALCEGPITGIGRVWADGEPFDMSGVTWRFYPGSETQGPDPLIAARMGAGNTPAYRGTAYIVFEDLPLERFGNRLPQLSFEVFRPVLTSDSVEARLNAVCVIPGSGEFTYGTTPVRSTVQGVTRAENTFASASRTDASVAFDQLQAQVPALQSVSIVCSWFGDDLRAGVCQIKPGVEEPEKDTAPYSWSVNGVSRAAAYQISRTAAGPVYGGTPADRAIIEAILDAKARGLRVTFYPFILMDVPAGNSRPNPYSDNAATLGQPAFPWRGRITCSPAAGFAGTVDQTATAGAQVAAFFGAAAVSDFAVSGQSVSWTGGEDWGLRRMILHYAWLCAVAGGVDAFLIGSELRGLTQVRSGAGTYPAVAALQALAADVRTILPGAKISYAADWSEYFGHQPQDGSGDVYFHLDPLWAHPAVDFVGIDNYMPISDWRDGTDHIDAPNGSIYNPGYLQFGIARGEGFDYFYASDADRAAQLRTPIVDGAAGKPWVFRYKDLRSWWSQPHFNRPGGVESGSPTAWVPQSKPIWFTEFGCPAVDRGTNQPNVFFDPKSSESALPHFSRGWRDDAIQRAYYDAHLAFWRWGPNNPVSAVYGGSMVTVSEMAGWAWDARPYPQFPELTEIFADSENWRLGHWLTGRLGSGSLPAVVRDLCLRGGAHPDQIDVSGLRGNVEGYVITALESARRSIEVLQRFYGFDAVESGAQIRFVMRGTGPVATFGPDDLVVDQTQREPFELRRAQETELPQALKWQVVRSDEEYDSSVVEAARVTVASARVVAEAFAMAVPPEEAEAQAQRALQEIWVGREGATLILPPSRLALEPGDAVLLEHDGRRREFRIVTIADALGRSVQAIAQDREVYGLPAGQPRRSALSAPAVFGAPTVRFLEVPQLRPELADHQPLLAALAQPWPGALTVWRSAGQDGFAALATVPAPARLGRLVFALPAGPSSRFDLATELVVELQTGILESVTDLDLFAGANAFAVETAPGEWEVLQAGTAELIAPSRYRLTRLLRGQRGSEHRIAPTVPANAPVVVLDGALVPVPVTPAELGLPFNWRIGPQGQPASADTLVAASFTARGEGLRPFAPVHAQQPWRRAREPGDYTIQWIRRDRDPSADSWAALEIPMSEAVEAYEVDIMSGSTVLRTLASATTSALYTAAAQIADWGALLGPGNSLRVRIHQLSATVGRGPALDVTLQF